MHYYKGRSGVGLIQNFRHSSRAIIIRCASHISVTFEPHSPRIHAKLRITLQETKMSTLQNETLFEEIYDMVWCDYRDNHNLTDDQLYALEQNSQYGYLLEIENDARKIYEDRCQ